MGIEDSPKLEGAPGRDKERESRFRERKVFETKNELRKIDEEIFNELNFGFNMPKTEDIVQVKRTDKSKEYTYDDISKFIKEGNYKQALVGVLSMFLGSKNVMKDLGYIAEIKENIPDHLKVGALLQVRNNHEESLKSKMQNSMIAYEFESSLLKKGYEKTSDVKPAKKIVIEPGKTRLEDYCSEEVLKKIRGDNPEVLLPLALQNSLPVGCTLYLDKDGLPLYILKKNLDLNSVDEKIPTIPLFKKREKKQSVETEREHKLEFLRKNLRRGDILLVGGGKKQDSYWDLLDIGIRSASRNLDDETAFHGVHSMVYDGENVLHLTTEAHKDGLEKILADNSEYKTLTIARVPEGVSEQFAKNVEEVFNKKKKYDVQGLINLAKSYTSTGKLVRTPSSDDSAICTDYVVDAAKQPPQNPLLPDLAKALTAADIAASSDVKLTYSLTL